MEVFHNFTSGVYTKRIEMQVGDVFASHTHKYDHLSIVGKGRVKVFDGSMHREYTGGESVLIEKNIPHAVEALEPSTWFCIHAESNDQHKEGI